MRPYPLHENQNTYLSALGNTANSHRLVPGNGIKAYQGPDGWHVSSTSFPKKDAMIWQGIYSFQNEYFPNDVVVISDGNNNDYVDQNNNPIPLTPGATYVCTTYVPPSQLDSTFLLGTVAPSFGGSVSDETANFFRWYDYNIYYPVNTTGSGVFSIVDSGYNIIGSQSFWQKIGAGGSSTPWAVYDVSASYLINDQVLVDPNKVPPYQISFIGVSGSTAPLVPGLFQCIASVPPATSGSRNTASYYYPIYPQIPSSSLVTFSGSTYNQNYWLALSPMVSAEFCVNGNIKTYWVNAMESASVFQYKLPYSGSGR